MNAMTDAEPELSWAAHATVRLFRRWVACRETGEPQLPGVVALGRTLGVSDEAAVALASLFQLTEACVGRPLLAECCCSRSFSPDERALLMLLAAAPTVGPQHGSAAVPHGLPSALAWASAAARRAIGAGPEGIGWGGLAPEAFAPRRCPFR